MARVSLNNLVKYYGDTHVVRSINLEIEHNEFVALIGPSGCGKSTTLRMIAGLEDISDGEVRIDGEVVNELEPKDRDIAMVFQDYALYPHMNVFENMSFGLSVQKVPLAEIKQRVDEAAAILNIGDLLLRKPKQLSGGQRQRVAMGRAIVRRPKVFLFDEPLSNLDAKLRVQMRTEMKKLHRRVATTVIYVTHDQVEAMTLADKIVVMRGGNIEQAGTPDTIYNQPATMFVAGFIGSPAMNFVDGTISADGKTVVLADGGSGHALTLTPALAARVAGRAQAAVKVGIRPENISQAPHGARAILAQVDVIEPLGSDTLVFFPLGSAEMVARVPPTTQIAVGGELALTIDPAHLHLFDPVSERAI